MRALMLTTMMLLGVACTTTPPGPPPMPPPPAAEPSAMSPAAFVAAEVEQLRPLYVEANRAWFEASVTGTDEAFARMREAENALNRFYADRRRFEQIKAHRADAGTTDPLLKRQLEVLYRSMLGKQVDPDLLEQITTIGSEVEQAFNTYRGKVGDREVTQNDIMKILRTSTDSAELQAAWEAQKAVGPLVAPKLARLVGLRNEVARRLGFRDYYALRIAENEQDEQQLLALFDELDRLTSDAFRRSKAEVDRRLAARLKLDVAELMPWHYQNPFFQEPPAVFVTGLNAVYQQQDTLALCRSFYTSIGLEIDGILKRSDLYEKQGKSPHAFCLNVDRKGDVRVLANIVPGQEWQSTMVHELGHAVYEQYVDRSLPWLLRRASHALTTEGIAMLLDRLVANPYWAEALGVIDAKQRDAAAAEARGHLAFAPLQFSRWAQVMLRFERAMYAKPQQDLSTLWWDLVEQYQGLRRPPNRRAPDYASKIHLVVAPVYYHNYMMGELFAAQVHEAIAKLQGKTPFETVYFGDPRVGELLKTKIFSPGSRLRWDELVRHATGTQLAPDAFARRLGGGR